MKRLLALIAIAACGGPQGPRGTGDPAAAVAALQASKFGEAAKEANATLGRDSRSSRAAVVRAIATYQMAGHELVRTLGKLIEESPRLELFDNPAGRKAWVDFLTKLDAIDRDLAVAAADPGFSLELCIACWEHDWNHSGQVDERDRKLFELEFDGKGGEIPEGDPRRRPTFRFDVGDVEWARAMVSFQRAAVELILAYKWSELPYIFMLGDRGMALTIKLIEPARVKRARELVITGLGYADRCREAYLAETDDDREWVPNPRQKSHPMPLEVDGALYETWAGVTGDVRRMLKSEEGISMRELVGLAGEDMVTRVPNAYIDLGRMLAEPKDLVIDARALVGRGEPDAAGVETLLRGVLGNGFQTQMKTSPLVGRLRAMKSQLDRDEDTFERKLRYLIWLN